MLPCINPPSIVFVVQDVSLQTVKTRSADMRQSYNATRPACRLPTEILSMIFLHLHVDYATLEMRSRYRPTHHMLLNLTHVCRYWRSVALGYARLWTSIPVVDYSCIVAFAARSKNMPVSARGRVSVVKREIKKCFRALPLSRLERVRLECAPPHGAAPTRRIVKMDLPGEEAPMLKVLNLSTQNPHLFAKLVEAPKEMPALVDLCVSRVEIDMTWLGTLINLTSLNIRHLRKEARGLLSVFRNTGPSVEWPQDLTPIENMQLQKFSVRDVANQSVLLLKTAIRARILTSRSQIYIHTSFIWTALALTRLVDTVCKTFLQCSQAQGTYVIHYMHALVCSVMKESVGDMRLTVSSTWHSAPLVANPRAAFAHESGTSPFPITFSLGMAHADILLLRHFWHTLLGTLRSEYPGLRSFGIDTLVVRADTSLPDSGCGYYWAGYPTFALRHIALIGHAVVDFCLQFAEHMVMQYVPLGAVSIPPPTVLPTLEDLQVLEFDFQGNPLVLDALKRGLIRRAEQAKELPANGAYVVPQMTLKIV
ncbi:hypothetical protein EVG20_g7520, partial [Dentipellis fragilis]